MSDYKLIGEDEHTFQIKHPDGSEFSIAKNAIGPGVHKEIKALKMADGGEVPDFEDGGSSLEKDQNPADDFTRPGPSPEYQAFYNRAKKDFPNSRTEVPFQNRAQSDLDEYTRLKTARPESLSLSEASRLKDYGAFLHPDVGTTTPQVTPPTNIIGPSPASINPNPNPQQSGVNPSVAAAPTAQDPYALQNAAIEAQKQAYTQVGQAQAQGYQQQAQNWNDYAKQLAATDQKYQPIEDNLNKQNQDLFNAIQNQKIDPNRVWRNMSTGNKILAGISIALSGIGAGLQGHGAQNQALNLIEKEIDRDVDAQRLELGKKQNLFSENLRQLGDIRAAKAATKAQLISVAQAQANAIAARSGSAQALANIKVLNASADLQKAQLNREAQVWNFKNKFEGGAGEGGIPLAQENHALMEQVIPGYGKTRVVAGDKVYSAQDEKTAEELRKAEQLYKPIKEDIDLIQGLAKQGVLTSPEGRSRAQAAQARLAMAVNEFNGYKRFTDTDEHTIQKMFNDPSSVMGVLRGEGATGDTIQRLQSKLESMRHNGLKGYRGTSQYKSFKPGV